MKKFFAGFLLTCFAVFLIPAVIVPVSMLFEEEKAVPAAAEIVTPNAGDAITTASHAGAISDQPLYHIDRRNRKSGL